MSDLVKRLRAPAYWFSESDEGHPGENSAPREAADRIEAMDGALTTERALTDGAHRRARAAEADRDAWKADAERLAEAMAEWRDAREDAKECTASGWFERIEDAEAGLLRSLDAHTKQVTA
jgi:hypothetical protein